MSTVSQLDLVQFSFITVIISMTFTMKHERNTFPWSNLVNLLATSSLCDTLEFMRFIRLHAQSCTRDPDTFIRLVPSLTHERLSQTMRILGRKQFIFQRVKKTPALFSWIILGVYAPGFRVGVAFNWILVWDHVGWQKTNGKNVNGQKWHLGNKEQFPVLCVCFSFEKYRWNLVVE